MELFSRSARGDELTPAGQAFIDDARLALSQVDAAIGAARCAAQPSKQRLCIGFFDRAGNDLATEGDEFAARRAAAIDVTVSSDYSSDLADGLARGPLDLAFLRAEPGFDLDYTTMGQEPLVVLMPSDHALTSQERIRP